MNELHDKRRGVEQITEEEVDVLLRLEELEARLISAANRMADATIELNAAIKDASDRGILNSLRAIAWQRNGLHMQLSRGYDVLPKS